MKIAFVSPYPPSQVTLNEYGYHLIRSFIGKSKVEEISQWKFNSCLLNLYHDGSEGMGWHSDDEPELVQAAPIASLSLGAARKFSFKHKADKTNASLMLENGSLLLMQAPTQVFWNHSLVKTTRPTGPRMNLTFRAIKA